MAFDAQSCLLKRLWKWMHFKILISWLGQYVIPYPSITAWHQNVGSSRVHYVWLSCVVQQILKGCTKNIYCLSFCMEVRIIMSVLYNRVRILSDIDLVFEQVSVKVSLWCLGYVSKKQSHTCIYKFYCPGKDISACLSVLPILILSR